MGDVLYQYRRNRGLLGVRSKVPVRDDRMLSLLYTPGVAGPCREIHRDPRRALDLTIKGNAVAIVSDGSGALAARLGPFGLIPLLEAQALLSRELGAVDAFPYSLKRLSEDTLVESASNLHPTVSALVLSHCAFPESLRAREAIQARVPVAVLDMAAEVGAILVMTGLFNVARRLGKPPRELNVLLFGLDAIAWTLLNHPGGLPFQFALVDPDAAASRPAPPTGVRRRRKIPAGFVPDAVVIERGDPPPELLAMSATTFVFDLSAGDAPWTPSPRLRRYWKGDDLSFHPALVFPGLFRGLLDCRATRGPERLDGIALELALLQGEPEVAAERIFPSPLDLRAAPTVAREMARMAARKGIPSPDPEELYRSASERIYSAGGLPAPAWWRRPRENAGDSDLGSQSVDLHERHGGAIEIVAKLSVRDEFMLRAVSPPNSLAPAEKITASADMAYEYSSKNNLVAVISDGSAVLGLGNIGPEAGLPVMEGKALLLKTLAGVDSFPICLATQDADEIVRTVESLLPILGGVNLEDISSPRCFRIEAELRRVADVPVFHDDQHGTAIVVLAGLLNAALCLGLPLEDLEVVINGAGAAAASVTRLLLQAGVGDVILCDTRGAIHSGRREGMNSMKEALAEETNREGVSGPLESVVRGRRVFVGLSKGGCLNQAMVRSMAADPIVFALANPTPEIDPAEALAAGAAVVATGRSDFPNQINNALAFPGVFRGTLDVRARTINDAMEVAAAEAIASLVPRSELRPDRIIPMALDARVAPQVAGAVARAALKTGQARVLVDPRVIRDNTREFLYGGRLNPVSGEPL